MGTVVLWAVDCFHSVVKALSIVCVSKMLYIMRFPQPPAVLHFPEFPLGLTPDGSEASLYCLGLRVVN